MGRVGHGHERGEESGEGEVRGRGRIPHKGRRGRRLRRRGRGGGRRSRRSGGGRGDGGGIFFGAFFGGVFGVVHPKQLGRAARARGALGARGRHRARTLLRARVPDGWRITKCLTPTGELPTDPRGTVDLTALRGQVSLRFQVVRAAAP